MVSTDIDDTNVNDDGNHDNKTYMFGLIFNDAIIHMLLVCCHEQILKGLTTHLLSFFCKILNSRCDRRSLNDSERYKKKPTTVNIQLRKIEFGVNI